MPTEDHRTFMKIGTSVGVTLPPNWLEFFKIEPGQKGVVLGNSVLVIVPPGNDELLEKARKIIQQV